jgi:hypothetical protein
MPGREEERIGVVATAEMTICFCGNPCATRKLLVFSTSRLNLE